MLCKGKLSQEVLDSKGAQELIYSSCFDLSIFIMFKASFTLALCINVINDQQRSRATNSKCQITTADQEGPFFEAGKIIIQFPSIQNLNNLYFNQKNYRLAIFMYGFCRCTEC